MEKHLQNQEKTKDAKESATHDNLSKGKQKKISLVGEHPAIKKLTNRDEYKYRRSVSTKEGSSQAQSYKCV